MSKTLNSSRRLQIARRVSGRVSYSCSHPSPPFYSFSIALLSFHLLVVAAIFGAGQRWRGDEIRELIQANCWLFLGASAVKPTVSLPLKSLNAFRTPLHLTRHISSPNSPDPDPQRRRRRKTKSTIRPVPSGSATAALNGPTALAKPARACSCSKHRREI